MYQMENTYSDSTTSILVMSLHPHVKRKPRKIPKAQMHTTDMLPFLFPSLPSFSLCNDPRCAHSSPHPAGGTR